jgi:hypothetical protein
VSGKPEGAPGWTGRKRRCRQRTRRWSKALRTLVVPGAPVGRRQRRRAGVRGETGRLRRQARSVNASRERGGDGRQLSAEGQLRRAEMAVGRPSQGGSTCRTLRSGARCNTRAEVWRRKPSRWCETTGTERGAAVAGRSRRRHDVATRSGLQAGDPRRKGVLWTSNQREVVDPASDGRAECRCGKLRRHGERTSLDEWRLQGQEGLERRSAKNGSPPV